MRIARFLERLLNLQRGDLGRGALLFAYLFLVITSYVVGRVARDALFLATFRADQLPYADIAVAVLVGLVVAGYVWIGRSTSLRNLLIGSLIVFCASCFLLWWLARSHTKVWLYPVFYVWVGIYGVLAPAQVWTLANYLLTTREAKRMFGLVGSGGISAWIFGGFFSKTVAKRFGTENLLLGMGFFLALSVVLVLLIWRQTRARRAAAAEADKAAREEAPRNLLESLRLVLSSRYLCAIAAVIWVSSFTVTVTGWQFKAFAKQFLINKDAMGAFFGNFNFYAAIICLVLQLLLTSRFLRRFGIGPALFILPLSVLAGSAAVLVWGTLAAAVLLKGSDQVLRYSLDKSTVELLYLPVPPRIKMQAKSFIDTVIWRLGDGFAGITVLIFATNLHWPARRLTWVVLVLILGWLGAVFVGRREYVGTLRQCIRQHRIDAERATAPVLDRSTTEIFADSLTAVDPGEILYALSLFEVASQQAAHPAVRGLLHHPSPDVRQKAISVLSAAGDTSVVPLVEPLLQDPHLEVRTEAMLYLTHHAHVDPLARIQELGDFSDFSLRSAMVSFLARPGETQNLEAATLILDAMVKEAGPEGLRTRLEAARLIGSLPDEFDAQLRILLADPDLEVARHAIRAVGTLRRRQLVGRVLDRLGRHELAPDITEALAKFGDRIVGTLRDFLADATVPVEARRGIPQVLMRIGTQAAARVLAENLFESDTTLRFRTISALHQLYQRHPELELDRQMIETVLAAEIMGHYRSYQILGTLGGNLESDDAVARALRESINQEVERIFRLLGLLHPRYDLDSVHFGLQSTNRVVHDNALEFLDNVLKPELRSVLVPLLDGDVSIDERVRRANRLVGAKVASTEEAVAALIMSEDTWLKSCGAYAIGTLGLKSLEHELESCLNHPDPLLRETARQAKLRLARQASA